MSAAGQVGLAILGAAVTVVVPGGWQAWRRARTQRLRILADLADLARHVEHLPAIRDVVVGTPADLVRGRPAQPGVAARLDMLEHRTAQLLPNGGSHVADVVRSTQTEVRALGQRITDHITNHPGPGGTT